MRSGRKIDWHHEAEYVRSNWKRSPVLAELEEVILDVETTPNNRPLGYVEDDIYMPVLTPQPYAIWTAKPNSLRRTNQR